MYEGVRDQFTNRNIGETREREPKQPYLDLLLGVAGLDPVIHLDHRPQEWGTTDLVVANFKAIEFLESDLVGGKVASDSFLASEQQEGTYGQLTSTTEKIKGPEKVGIGKVCENSVAAGAGQLAKPSQLGSR